MIRSHNNNPVLHKSKTISLQKAGSLSSQTVFVYKLKTSFVVSMLYCLIVSNFFLIVASVLGKEKKKNKYQIYDMKNSLPEEIFDEKEVVTPGNVKLVEDETLEEEL